MRRTVEVYINEDDAQHYLLCDVEIEETSVKVDQEYGGGEFHHVEIEIVDAIAGKIDVEGGWRDAQSPELDELVAKAKREPELIYQCMSQRDSQYEPLSEPHWKNNYLVMLRNDHGNQTA